MTETLDIPKALLMLAIPLGIDLLTCFLGIRSNRRKSTSGFPIVTLFLYAYIVLRIPTLGAGAKALALALAAVVHVVLVFVIPYVDNQILHRSRSRPNP